MGEIQSFLEKRKEDWLRTRLKPNQSEEEQQALREEADTKFSLAVWLPDAAKRAGWLSLTTHPSKFSHPSAKTSMIMADAPYDPDGFLRSGNVVVETDVLGNAAALDVYKFLSLELSDGQTVLEHVKQGTPLIREIFHIPTASFTDLQTGFLSIYKQDEQPITHERVKQVYFPVEDRYHLLSILTPSGIVYEMHDRIQQQRFSDATKEAREAQRKQEHHEKGHDELYGLAMIGYGGTKPQNISVLNSQHGGKAYLLPSIPPKLERREIPYPRKDFFAETLWLKQFQQPFMSLHEIFRSPRNNKDIRDNRDVQLVEHIWDKVIHRSLEIREQQLMRPQDVGWSRSDYYQHLPRAQKIWLDNHYHTQRDEQDTWRQAILQRFLGWLFEGYVKTLKDRGAKPIPLSDYESRDFKNRLFDKRLESLR